MKSTVSIDSITTKISSMQSLLFLGLAASDNNRAKKTILSKAIHVSLFLYYFRVTHNIPAARNIKSTANFSFKKNTNLDCTCTFQWGLSVISVHMNHSDLPVEDIKEACGLMTNALSKYGSNKKKKTPINTREDVL